MSHTPGPWERFGHLIAAAPALLAACKAVAAASLASSSEERFGENVREIMPAILAAIAAAEPEAGRQ